MERWTIVEFSAVWRSTAYWRHTYESQVWQLLIYYLLAQNIPFFVCCSVIMEVGFVNISPLPAGKALRVVIKEGAGRIRKKGFLFHVPVCLAHQIFTGHNFPHTWLLLWKAILDPSSWSLMWPTAARSFHRISCDGFSMECCGRGRHSWTSSLTTFLGDFIVLSEAWHQHEDCFPQHLQRTDF